MGQDGQEARHGQACIRFKKVEDLALDVIGEAIKRVPAKKYIAHCEASVESRRKTGDHRERQRSRQSPKVPLGQRLQEAGNSQIDRRP